MKLFLLFNDKTKSRIVNIAAFLFFIYLNFIFLNFDLFAEINEPSKNDHNLQNLIEWLWDPKLAHQTLGTVIVQNDEVVFEKFKEGIKENKFPLWSISKTVSVILLGILEKEKLISKDYEIGQFHQQLLLTDHQKPGTQHQIKSSIKLKHLATMQSGLDWSETYEAAPFRSDVVRMLYFTKDMGQYAIERPVKVKPGEKFYYSSGDTNILMKTMALSLPESERKIFPWKYLFDPLNISATFETDQSGTFLGSSYLYLNAMDLLKISQLILNRGKFQKLTFFDEDFYNFMTNGLNDSISEPCDERNMIYGAGVWLNLPCKNKKLQKYHPNGPDDLIILLGHFGQSVYLFPSKKLIVMRFARDQGKVFDRQKYFNLMMKLNWK